MPLRLSPLSYNTVCQYGPCGPLCPSRCLYLSCHFPLLPFPLFPTQPLFPSVGPQDQRHVLPIGMPCSARAFCPAVLPISKALHACRSFPTVPGSGDATAGQEPGNSDHMGPCVHTPLLAQPPPSAQDAGGTHVGCLPGLRRLACRRRETIPCILP
jgi:hypothetical protein